jgi:hypothetical protein
MDWQGIAVLVTAIGTIISMFLHFRQKSYDSQKEYELKKREEYDREQRKQLKIAANDIVRELYRLMNVTDAQRAYIVQPHPLDRAKFISIEYEVISEGMTAIARRVHRMPIVSVHGFANELSSRDFILWQSQKEVRDDRARAIMHSIGTEKMAAFRMMDDKLWLGNIVLDFDQHQELQPVYLKDKMGEVANVVKYILPEIEE